MANLQGFDARTVEPQQTRDFSPIPAGDYKAVITGSEEKENKARTGSYLELVLQVIEGEHKGRQLWERLNLNNPNATAVEIAQQTLSAICRAVNIMTPSDSSELHDLPMVISVAHDKRKDTGAIVNVIKGYKSQQQAFEQSQAQAAQAPTAPAGNKPAWMS